SRFGAVAKLTGPNNLSTTWEYDSFGRKTKEARADGTQTTWEYVRCASGCSITLKTVTVSYTYYVQATPRDASGTQNGAYTRTYFDALNREIRGETQGFASGTVVYKDTEYDSLGRVAYVSQPYYSGQTAYWNTYAYDVLGRVTQVTDVAGAVTYTDYAGLV